MAESIRNLQEPPSANVRRRPNPFILNLWFTRRVLASQVELAGGQ